jgi:hypothetical protein
LPLSAASLESVYYVSQPNTTVGYGWAASIFKRSKAPNGQLSNMYCVHVRPLRTDGTERLTINDVP